MAKKGNMNLFIFGRVTNGSRLVGSKKKSRRIKRGK